MRVYWGHGGVRKYKTICWFYNSVSVFQSECQQFLLCVRYYSSWNLGRGRRATNVHGAGRGCHSHGQVGFAPSEPSCALAPGCLEPLELEPPQLLPYWPLARLAAPRSPPDRHAATAQSGVRGGPAPVLLSWVEGRVRARSRSRHTPRSTPPVRSTVPHQPAVVQQWQCRRVDARTARGAASGCSAARAM